MKNYPRPSSPSRSVIVDTLHLRIIQTRLVVDTDISPQMHKQPLLDDISDLDVADKKMKKDSEGSVILPMDIFYEIGRLLSEDDRSELKSESLYTLRQLVSCLDGDDTI